jgi:two-component system CheB/CheR fusion protein
VDPTAAPPDSSSRAAPSDERPPYIVGIGASAGGLAALEHFFDNLPDNPGMAFVVIQHLSPDFRSLMDELLARHTSLPIHLVEDGMRVEADHVYLIPPRMEMIISGGRLLLSERSPQPELTLPIDTFFRSLARDCRERAVAIVLSGGGSDGSRGIRDVRDAGGVVLVQDMGTAQFDGMPKTAREAGVAQWVLAPQDMPHVLVEHVAQRQSKRHAEYLPAPAPATGGIDAVYGMLEEQFGIDFTHYKPSTITRRIERRLALAHSANIDEYLHRLRDDRNELDVLYRDLLIGVTHFFRDEEAFAVLEQRVLPELFEQQPREEPLRLWVAGCATGEEAYSLAITVHDVMLRTRERPVKIFATDVHRGSLERGARGIYDAEALARVSPERLARYFARVGDAYQVVPELRKTIVFAQHNVIRDAPFTRVDLLTCRNLLIYLQPAAQDKVLSLFHFALKRGGRLMLGPSETVGSLTSEFRALDKHWRLYEKNTDARMVLDSRARLPSATGFRLPMSSPPRHSLTQLIGTYDAILDSSLPPSLLVTDRGELVHTFAGASQFLRLRDGRQDLNVFDIVDAELKMVLVGGIKRALDEPTPLVFRNIRLDGASESRPYDVTLKRIRSRTSGAPHVLISFEESRTADRLPAVSPTEVKIDQISRDQLSGLEAELSHTKENLQTAIEELETSNEELQAANEELQASNEELQSTNEELQSVNEELYTVNAEYQRKIGELTELTNDMDNLLASTEVGTVFLDKQLRIRKFTPQIADTFALVPHDVGRAIETFANKLHHPELVVDLRRVLNTAEPVEREIRDTNGKTFFLRIFPYRGHAAVDGVVLTLIDVSGLKAAEDALFHERHLLNSLLGTTQDAIYFKDSRRRFIRANSPMAARLGLASADEVAGKSAGELPDPELGRALDRHDEMVLRTGEAEHHQLEPRIVDGERRWDSVTRLPLRDAEGRIVGATTIFRDVTDQKTAEESIREAVRRRDQFLAMLSHELRNPLAAIVSAIGVLKAHGTTNGDGRLVDVLDRQTTQMAHLLDELLEASRVIENKIVLKKELVDLNDVARDAVDAVRPHVDARRLELRVDLAPGALVVDGDPARLQQVLVNLLTNAAKYTPPCGHVIVTTRRESGLAVISVTDDGAGIAPDLLESIFELFVQSRRTLDRAEGGLGLGLSLVRSLVAMHGGKVAATSEGEGRGSTFTVTLPIGSAALGAPARRKEGSARAPADPSDALIVLVEDNLDSREVLTELLELSGRRCRSVESGAAALEILDELRPAVALIDLGLPGIDGFDVARRIRARPDGADIRLVALTGYGQPADRAAGRAAGFDAHLVKPVRLEQLTAILDELTRGRDPGASSVSSSSAAAYGRIEGQPLAPNDEDVA